jgi:hypothetical protein
MDFKEYYHKKLDEEIELGQKSAAEASYQTQAMNSSAESLVNKYIGSSDIKEGMKQLAVDLGNAIYNYAINTYVTDEMFDSADAKNKYINIITQKIQQQANSTLVDLLRHAAIDIQNTKNSLTV